MNGYNLIAPYYDDLAGLIFGNDLFTSQMHFFHQIPSHSKVLVLGGGSGWFIPYLFNQRPSIELWYVDSAERMIQLAQKRSYPNGRIHFIHGTDEQLSENLKFDVIMLPFFVDGFNLIQLENILIKLKGKMSPNGIFIITDYFATNRLNHKFILWFMHLTFGTFVNNPNKRLVNWWKAFEQLGFSLKEESVWKGGLIKTAIYCNE